jgi:transglutaminase-like putative cysteine protease
MEKFLRENKYIDFSNPAIQKKSKQLFDDLQTDVQKAKTAYEFVRDEISHSFDVQSQIVTAIASDVLKYQTGICHAKANLLAALLRLQNIPTGFCFQRLTFSNDDSLGYCIHCYNAIYLDRHWVKVDARGNKEGIKAEFSMSEPKLAFPNRKKYAEYFYNGIYANPHTDTMNILEKASMLQDVMDNFPDNVTDLPDIP